ncbi:CTLH/CRA C-terminal to lish motif domain-containing protein [Geopyxis carbonaria]|nr:CTLH/CRA C-terminal to lish motif domain-containing protein [Geopyxis carbonaria]
MSASTSKLDAESHLLLDEPLLRLPHEMLRKTFKTAQKHYEREQSWLMQSIKETTRKAADGVSAQDSLNSLDSIIIRMQGYKRKVENLHEEEKTLHGHSRKRIAHLQNLYEIPNLEDPAYDRWSRIRLDRLLVDFLLRSGYGESARLLASEKDIEELVDVDVFVQCAKIEQSLRRGNTAECLSWCAENKASLRKQKSTLEFELRQQQFIELVREGRKKEAIAHSKRFLASYADVHANDIYKVSGLLAILPTTQCARYKSLYSADRWQYLATSFINTHHNLYGLPQRPVIHIALSAGLSSLKTPSCHSSMTLSSGNTSSSTTSLCPICSTELNDLARNVPYAHHDRSSVEPDPVVLPNGRIYGRERIALLASKLSLPAGTIRDPTTGEEFDAEKVKKVYIM